MKFSKKLRSFFSFFITLALLVTAVPVNVLTAYVTASEVASFVGGNGTVEDPYLIETVEQLNNIRNNLEASYRLSNDIVFSKEDFEEQGIFYNDAKGWDPIGTQEMPFRGSFDGGGHSISNLMINQNIEGNLRLGLFGTSFGKIENVKLQQSTITVIGNSTAQTTSYDNVYVGSVVGYGSATNCTSSGSIDISYSSIARNCYLYSGGVVGYGNADFCANSCDISVATSSGSKSIFAYVGGICGRGQEIEQCSNSGIITGKTSGMNERLNIGGIAGLASNVTTSFNKANITAIGSSRNIKVGGLCGIAGADSLIDQSYNTGVVMGSMQVNAGGIAGYLGGSGTIKNSFNTGAISGGWCGGILGEAFGSVTISNCYNTGYIEEGYYKYAILGSAYDYAIINCYSLDNIARARSVTNVCSEDEMQNKETFLGLDFESVWLIEQSSPYLLPQLRSIPMESNLVNIQDCEISLDTTSVQYHTYQPQITVKYNGETLVPRIDYLAIYKVGEETWLGDLRYVGAIGTASIIIAGNGKYCGIERISFEVTKFDVTNAHLMTHWVSNGDGSQSSSSYDMKNFSYDGSEKKQSDFRVCDDNDTIDPSNYEIIYKDNIEVGTATMIITGKGDYYTGVLTKPFSIYMPENTTLTIAKKPNKLEYVEGEDLDTTGLIVTANYDNGYSTVITGYTISGYSSTVGTKTIIVSYGGKTATFTVDVLPFEPASIKYRTHVQKYGWQEFVADGTMSGTSGLALRLEGVEILVDSNLDLGVQYSTHIQNIGWQDYVVDGAMSGTSGQALRLEAIKIELTGADKDRFDVYYRVHAEKFGWMDWAKNGNAAGTAGFAYRLEGIEIRIVEKGTDPGLPTATPYRSKTPVQNICYRTHVQNIGWQDYVYDGAMSGTSGLALRLEGIEIEKIGDHLPTGSIEYTTHVQKIGWQDYVADGAMSGTSGLSLRLEAIRIRLSGTMEMEYDIYYRVHAQKFGWMGWAKNGEDAGTAGFGYRLEGIEILLVSKGEPAPGSTANAFVQK